MKLSQYIDTVALSNAVIDGRVTARQHKTLPLAIYTYSKQTVIKDDWDAVTSRCRGLIVDLNTGDVLARPFEKFFNLDTLSHPETLTANLPSSPPTVTEKLDGSLGILYCYNGEYSIASKGSFHSDHAEWATKWYRSNVPDAVWPLGHTVVFEMICEKVQHHVVHYGNDRLVLTAIINNATGEELTHNALTILGRINGLEVVEQFDKSIADVVVENRLNAEGYVLSWERAGQPPLKVKVKHAEFKRLQRILHYVRPKDILAFVVTGANPDCPNCDGTGTVTVSSICIGDTMECKCHCTESLDEWLKYSTPEFATYVQMWVTRFTHEYEGINARCRLAVKSALLDCTDRKEFAEWFFREIPGYASVCFAMLDEKDYQRIIWKHVQALTKNAEPFAFKEEE